MADLSSTRVFGKLTVIHDAILRANAEITGSLTISGNTAWHAGNHGSGSGLDADLLDGLQATQFARTDIKEVFSASLGIGGSTPSSTFDNGRALAFDDNDSGIRGDGDGVIEIWSNNQEVMHLTNGAVNSLKPLRQGGQQVWHQGNDGAGSGLDADKLDGKQLTDIEQDAESAAIAVAIALG